MIFNHSISSALVALVVLTGSAEAFPGRSLLESSSRLAQVTPQSVTGQLDENSQVLRDNSYFNLYTFEGTAGEIIVIDMTSEEFDTYLILRNANGNVLVEDDDGGTNTNARILVQIPSNGTYQILANAYGAGMAGRYSLSWRAAREDERELYRATQLNLQGFSLYQAGRAAAAIPLLQEALQIRRTLLGERHIDYAEVLNNLATVYAEQGRYPEAGLLSERALDISREVLGATHPTVAQVLMNMGSIAAAQGRYSEAEALYTQALAARRLAFGEYHPAVSESLTALAEVYQRQGRYGEAESTLEQGLEVNRQLGESHPNVALTLMSLASVYVYQGRYGEAEPLYLRALEINREALGGSHPTTILNLNNLAEMYYSQGRYREARPFYEQALAINRNAQSDNSLNLAVSLTGLALVYMGDRRYDEAEPLLIEALELSQRRLGVNHPDTATSLDNLANLYAFQRRYGEAIPLLRQALTIRRTVLGDNHPDVAASLSNLARFYPNQEGSYDEAILFYQQALEINRATLGQAHPSVASNLSNLAWLYYTRNEIPQTLEYLRQGLEVNEYQLDLNLATLTVAQSQEYIARTQPFNETELAIHINLHHVPTSATAKQLALTTVLRRKGRILDASVNSLQRLRHNLTLPDQALLDRLTETRSQLAALLFNPSSALSPEQYQTTLRQLESQEQDFESTLVRRSAAFRAEAQPVTVELVQSQLEPDTVLVEYIRYRYIDLENRRVENHYAAYLLFPNGRIEAVDLGNAAEIDTAVQSFTRLLQDRLANFQTRNATVEIQVVPQRVEQVTRTIRSLIFDPIVPYLGDRHHLLISPDSQLNRLPFEALQTSDQRYLVEQYQISYLNSGRDLLGFGAIAPSQAPAVVLANPDYNTAVVATTRGLNQQRSTDLRQLQVGALPGTAREAESLRALLPGVEILIEQQATEQALKQVQAPSILHIATHGFFLEDQAVTLPQSLTGATAGSPLAAPEDGEVENPLLRSGLALAGFNQRISGSEDGVFTALEAANLNLAGTQLVVLSACNTSLGDIANGEGVYGLRRAFAIAGAETQLMSLWQVSDDGTQNLMAHYYENLIAGMGRSEALRSVQLEMIRAGGPYSHPYYWAPFILSGNWHPLVSE